MELPISLALPARGRHTLNDEGTRAVMPGTPSLLRVRKSLSSPVLVLTLSLLLFSIPLTTVFAEETKTGQITGIVVDASTREPLPGASVTLIGTRLGAATTISGEFLINNVPVGEYSAKVSLIGYTAQVKGDVVVNSARPTAIRIELIPSFIETEGIVVRPDYFSSERTVATSTQTQSAEEIRRLPGGFEDVVRAISILPGVAQAEPGRNDLIVRGGAPSENLFIVDNLEIPNINHFGSQGNTGGPISMINLDFVEETSFSTGGFGVRYGDKLSSVLEIDLREGRRDEFGGKGTISATQFGLNLEGPLHEKGSFLFSARRSYLDLIFRAADFAFVPEYWDFLGKADYRLDRSNKLSLLGIGAIDNVRQFNDDADDRFDNSRVLDSDQKQFVGAVSWQHVFGYGFSTVTFGQTYVDYNYRQNDSLLNPVFLNDSYEHESSLRGDLTLNLGKYARVYAGIQGKAVRFYSDMFVLPYNNSFGQYVDVDKTYETTATKAAAYAELSGDFGNFQVRGGGRVDYFDMIESEYVASPRAVASFDLTQSLSINAGIGRYYQAPSYIWLVANEQNRNLDYVGVNQYIFGFALLVRSDTRITLEGFYKDYFDYPASTVQEFLVLANTGAGFGGREEGFVSFGIDPLVSEGSGRSRGFELLVQKKLSQIPCYGIAGVTYSKTEFTALDGIERPGSFDQRWLLNLGGGYVFNEKWEFSTKFQLATGRPYTPYQTDGSQRPEEYNTARLATNHRLDIRVDRRWNFDGWAMITYIDIQNVYNKQFEGIPSYNARIGEVEADDNIGILPSIGVSIEF